MATDDQSIATKTENWLVTTIQAIGAPSPVFASADAVPWYGSIAENAASLAEDIIGGQRTPVARVRFLDDTTEHLEAGDQKRRSVYEIYVGVQHLRGKGETRRGDGTALGTNGLRDLLYIAIHNKQPAQVANGRATEPAVWGGVQQPWDATKSVIMVCRVNIDDVPAAA
jgi:hypothetical protein